MNKQNSIDHSKLFAAYPSVDKFHVTADGQAFEHSHYAEAHSKHLDAPNVDTVHRKHVEKPADEVALVKKVAPVKDAAPAKEVAHAKEVAPAKKAVPAKDAKKKAAAGKK
jgi:hypothetical protein